jgi:hypothetical protein
MPYTHTSFAAAKQRIADDLGDSGKVFFTDEEIGRYLVEALRWWGLNSMYFRETGKIETVVGEPFYRIETDLTDGTGLTLIQGLSVTDRELINDLNFMLMEPQISAWAGGWVGTEMFSLSDITNVLTESRDEFLKLTACIASGYDLGAIQQRVSLPSDHVRILRADINEVGSAGPLPLWPVDQAQIYSTIRSASFPEQRRPKAYSVSYSPQLTVDLWPPPQVNSTLNIQGVRTGGTLDPTALATTLLIPDDASFILKYRVLLDLFSGDGLVRCPQMAQYCEMRYADGLESMANYLSLLWQNDGGPRGQITTVAQWDQSSKANWRQVSGGPPRSVAQLNWNTIAVRPVPDDEYAITFESVRKAILPTVDGDFIQIGREHIQAIYEYATHIALIKCQGVEFDVTLKKYESAKQMALEYRQQVAAQSYLYQATQLPSLQERWFRPLRKQTAVQSAREDRQLVEA